MLRGGPEGMSACDESVADTLLEDEDMQHMLMEHQQGVISMFKTWHEQLDTLQTEQLGDQVRALTDLWQAAAARRAQLKAEDKDAGSGKKAETNLRPRAANGAGPISPRAGPITPQAGPLAGIDEEATKILSGVSGDEPAAESVAEPGDSHLPAPRVSDRTASILEVTKEGARSPQRSPRTPQRLTNKTSTGVTSEGGRSETRSPRTPAGLTSKVPTEAPTEATVDTKSGRQGSGWIHHPCSVGENEVTASPVNAVREQSVRPYTAPAGAPPTGKSPGKMSIRESMAEQIEELRPGSRASMWRQSVDQTPTAVHQALATVDDVGTSPSQYSLSYSSSRTTMFKHMPEPTTVLGKFIYRFTGLRSWQDFPLHDQRGKTTQLQRFVRSHVFRVVSSLVILINAVCIGMQVDHNLQRIYDDTKKDTQEELWVSIEVVFCVFFVLELLLRVAAERVYFIVGRDWRWNLFDTWLVISSLISLSANFQGDNSSQSFSFARILRLFRFTRVLRILRAMRFSQSLRLMLLSILSSLMSLLWVFLLLLFVIYFFTIFFLTGVIEHFNGVSTQGDSLIAIQEFYGSTWEAQLTLFMCISGGIDWKDAEGPLREMGVSYTIAFLVYMFFMVFGVLNVVVAAFVDAAYQVSARDREAVTKMELKREKEYVQHMKEFFREADTDRNGTLSWQEFETYLKDPQVAAFFAALDLDVSVARALFVLLDVDDTNSVGIDEFVGGCLRLKGTARSIDVNMLLYENKNMIMKFGESLDQMIERMKKLERTIGIWGASSGQKRLSSVAQEKLTLLGQAYPA